MRDYRKPDAGWCGDRKRGAAMGRISDLSFDSTGPLQIHEVPLDGDYDPGGTYWGGGTPLYFVSDSEDRVNYVRAKTFEEARARFPSASWEPTALPNEDDIADMLHGFVRAGLALCDDDRDSDSGGKPLDYLYTADDIEAASRDRMFAYVRGFAEANGPALATSVGRGTRSWEAAGIQLWYQAAGHGGFDPGDGWDASLKDAAGGSCYLLLGDDGVIYWE